MSIKITWEDGPRNGIYPILIKGAAIGATDGRLLVAGGMSYPWREVESGFWLGIDEGYDVSRSLSHEGMIADNPFKKWNPLPTLPIGSGWTSGAAVAGGLAVVGGRRLIDGNNATADIFFLDVLNGSYTWERLPDRPTPAMVATTFAHEDMLYTAFGSDWHPHEHAVEDTNIYCMKVLERHDNSFSEWDVLTKFPGEKRWMGGMNICNGKLYVVGGRDIPVDGLKDLKPYHAYMYDKTYADRVHFGELWEYDLGTGVWKELEHTPRVFCAEAFVVEDRWLVVTGGFSYYIPPDGEAVAVESFNDDRKDRKFHCLSHEVFAYDTHTNEWSQLGSLPYGVASHRVAVWKDRVYIVGNETRDDTRSNSFGTVFVGHIEID